MESIHKIKVAEEPHPIYWDINLQIQVKEGEKKKK